MSILQQGVGYVSLFFISRYMGPEPLGIISAAMAFTTVFMGFSDLGFGIAHVKMVSSGDHDLGKCIGTYGVIKFVLVTIVGLICLGVILYGHFGNGALPVPKEFITVMYIMLVVSLIDGYSKIASFTFAAKMEKAKEWLSLFAIKLVTATFRTVTAIAGLGVIYLAYSSLVATLVGALIAVYFIRKYPLRWWDFSLAKKYAIYALPAFFIGISATLSQEFDKLFLGYLSTAEEVGYYTGAKSVVQLITLISVVFVSLLLPTYSRLYSEGKIKEIAKFAYKIERYLSYPLLAVTFFMFFFSSPLQDLFLGDKFVQSEGLIKILVINAMMLIILQPYTAQLMGMDRIKTATWLSVVVLALNMVFYIVFIPDSMGSYDLMGLGSKGAAFALLASTAISTALFRYHAFKLTSSKPNWILILNSAVAVVVFWPLSYLIVYLDFMGNFLMLGSLFTIGFALYIGLLSIFGLFNRSDIVFYLETLNLRKLLVYVKGEVSN
jgi:O-antigen/teichoic acid export membrane protein